MSKPSQLTAECASFTAWQMQMTAYLGIQRFRSQELTEAQLVQMVVMAIDVKLLRYLSVDGRTTVRSLCEAAEVQWRKARRPANPTASFYAVKCGNDLRSALHALEETGYYFGAVDQVVRQRLVEILPLTVRQLASVEIARNPTISSSALLDLLEVVLWRYSLTCRVQRSLALRPLSVISARQRATFVVIVRSLFALDVASVGIFEINVLRHLRHRRRFQKTFSCSSRYFAVCCTHVGTGGRL